MKSGFNPVRRSRNIGTAKQGHGQANRLVVPEDRQDFRSWGECLGPHQQFQRSIRGRDVNFVVEETRSGYEHACTIEDVTHVLAGVPFSDWERIGTFVLRQSTRKQRIMRPAWGRMYYSADLGLPGRASIRFGPAITLEAQDPNAVIRWPTSLDPDDQRELERLREDGHRVEREGSRFIISTTLAATRATQLYRTLLHEIGHWVDYLEKVDRPADLPGADHDALSEAYFARPKDEREAFAHRYAEAMRTHLTRFGVIPFEQIPTRTRESR